MRGTGCNPTAAYGLTAATPLLRSVTELVQHSNLVENIHELRKGKSFLPGERAETAQPHLWRWAGDTRRKEESGSQS